MKQVICSWCDKVIREEAGEGQKTAICPECYAKVKDENQLAEAPIPSEFGKCDILTVHDNGDLLVECSGDTYLATAGGDVFKKLAHETHAAAPLPFAEEATPSTEDMPAPW